MTDQLPQNIQFEVSGGTPIDLPDLFTLQKHTSGECAYNWCTLRSA